MIQCADNGLKWAFGIALLLHLAALLAFAWMPLARQGGMGIERIQVFNSEAPISLTPVSLVPWEEEQQAVLLPAVDVEPAPAIVKTVRPKVKESEPVRVRPAERPKTVPTPAAAQAVKPVPQTVETADSLKPGPVLPSASAGGGGGGTVDLGAPSDQGTVALPSGGTSLGQLPGSGGGSGSGEGEGEGEGAGDGPGTGSGESGDTTPQEDPGPEFTSRVADRAAPKVISKGRLVYPEAAQEEGIEGTVVFKVLVNIKGEVAGVEISKSSGDRRLDRAAARFVRRWSYQPAVQDGKPRQVQTRATVKFELN